ncbi:putative nucleotidyltransferase substrate binding domain-containing protein [[Micrococcus luteus] ATCC 49442]|uniref:putative nucleotidyltransferase substrate binding domain-containing protein n=1 Tax=[Micrococcus luteus] ATCC 49442 TaxID=2698727 RepID=UPI0013DB773B|nr:putative nucleotidyltransferase substrate binding domain-containing protein [[Micrococcus luteus] ATCC 49442]
MKEFVDFLASHSPYSNLGPGDLERLARVVEVEFFPAGHEVIRSGETGLEHIYVIRTGGAEVSDRGRVVDVLGPGDTFGHIAVLSGLPPAMSVSVLEDTLCYRLPDPRSVVAEPAKLQFRHYSTLVVRQRLIEAASVHTRTETKVTAEMRPVTWCAKEASVREIARFMTDQGLRSVLIGMGSGFGIVTDDDFRSKVGTGDVGLDAPIERIASFPVHTAPESSTMWEAYLRMVKEDVHNMVLVDQNDRPVGTVNVIDLATSDVRHPLLVRSMVSSAQNVQQLGEACDLLKPTVVELWEAKVPSVQISAVISTVVDAVLLKILELGVVPHSELDQSWILTGSMARQEPLPDSDVDTAVLWRPGGPRPGEIMQQRAEDFIFKLDGTGLRPCADGANASSPLFNRSKENWRAAIEQWVTNPQVPKHLVMASTAMDSRPITKPYLGNLISEHVVDLAKTHRPFQRALLRSALQDRPPMGFVRNSVIGRFGEGQRYLDLKSAGLRPIASLARALAVQTGETKGSTVQRLETAASAGLLSTDESDTLITAFTMYHGLLTEQRILGSRKSQQPGTSIVPAQLDTLTRRHLRDGFRATAQVQERVGKEIAGPYRF